MATDINGVVLGNLPGGRPHLLIPFTIEPNGSAATIEQGTTAELVQSVANLCGTRPGTRFMVPQYGMPDPTFAGVDPVGLRLACAKWEKRVNVSAQVTEGNPQYSTVSVSPA